MRLDIANVTLMDSWAEEEFGTADLGDARRTKRLMRTGARLWPTPVRIVA